jgi:hypothetical protein
MNLSDRKITTFVKHFMAMQLIVGMDSGQSGAARFPNFGRITKDEWETAPKVAQIDGLTGSADKDEKFRYLLDMLHLVDPDVYRICRQMLRESIDVSGVQVDQQMIERTTVFNSAMLDRATRLFGVPLWVPPPPHCYWVLREVVADLLR